MTKISQYSTDVNITGNDKWIGSDAQNFLITKNFTPNNLANYFNENNVIDIGSSIRYRYQTLLPGEAREQGTISFETEIGPQVNFSAITTFLIAKNTLKGNTVTQYLDFLVDGKVLLSKASNINIFGYYKITSIEPWIPNTNFFVVEVDFLTGNGFISEDLDYLVSLVDKVQDIPPPVWGSITGDIEDQTDLINYISSQIITPTLQSVLAEGNTTGGENIVINDADAIQLENSSTLKKGTYDFGADGGISRICGVGFEDMWQSGIRHVFDSNGLIRNSTNGFNIVPDASFDNTLRFKVDSLWTLDNGDTYKCTNASTGAAVWELVNTGTTPTLQEVLDNNHDLVDGNFFAGTAAGLNNTGNEVIALGGNSSEENTGNYINSLGFMAGVANIGDNNNFLGALSGSGNEGDNVNAFGDASCNANTGNSVNALGGGAGNSNPFDNVNLFGANANADENGQTVLSKDGAIMARISTTDLTETHKYNLPDASGTLALTSDITPSPLTTKGDIYTYSTLDTRLPVGLDTQVLLADSTTPTGLKWATNTSPTPLGYYGAFSDVTDQFATVINTGYPMLLGVTDLTNGVTIVSGSRVTIANTGIYNIQWSGQLRNPTAADHDVTIWLRKNGVDVPGSAGVVLVPKKHGSFDGHTLPSWNYLLDAIAGDYYEFVWSTEDLAVFISFEPPNSPAPSTASVILTVTQQSGIMAGTGITAINSLTSSTQTMVVGTGGTNFNIVSSGSTHTFNLLFNIRRNANNSSNNNINYNGYAVTGSAESSAVWNITRLTISASGAITIATATNVAWTNRESATYI